MTTPLPLASLADSDDYPPLSALNHLLFCPRRCALLRNEGVWVENRFTVEGTHAHRKVHTESVHAEETGRVVRGLRLRSDRLRLVGVADLVEFRPEPYPVEYKRGKRRKWDNDDVQLCAQALCLEEMLGVAVPAGAVFHVRSQRRREVVFDAGLRGATEDAVRRLHALLASGAGRAHLRRLLDNDLRWSCSAGSVQPLPDARLREEGRCRSRSSRPW